MKKMLRWWRVWRGYARDRGTRVGGLRNKAGLRCNCLRGGRRSGEVVVVVVVVVVVGRLEGIRKGGAVE